MVLLFVFQANSFLLSLSIAMPSYYTHSIRNVRNKHEDSWEPHNTLSFVLSTQRVWTENARKQETVPAISEDGEQDQPKYTDQTKMLGSHSLLIYFKTQRKAKLQWLGPFTRRG